ncbi:MAG TPA: hypothetical protein VH186_27285 [Chloroflexia bacterium]|nr:hypothetical protein [Chloroflexia bacterium]
MASRMRELVRSNPVFLPVRSSYHVSQLLRSKDERKYTLEWVKSFKSDYMLDKPAPFINFQAADWVKAYLKGKTAIRVFEYGSGASTIFWLSMKAEVISVEHDADWYRKIKQRLSEADQIDYRLVEPEKAPEDRANGDPADPDLCISALEPYRGLSFASYVSQVDAFPDEYFDVIMVDGRSRASCLVHSLPKVKTGGIIILDNSDRERYTRLTAKYLENYNFELIKFKGFTPSIHLKETTSIYRKL